MYAVRIVQHIEVISIMLPKRISNIFSDMTTIIGRKILFAGKMS